MVRKRDADARHPVFAVDSYDLLTARVLSLPLAPLPATGSSKAAADVADTRVKRHPLRKPQAANVPGSSPPSYAAVAAGHSEASPRVDGADDSARSLADLAKIAVVDEIVAQEDLYGILAIKRTATSDEIRRGFLSRSRMCHPDKLPSYAPCVLAFQKVSFAYQTLSKPSSRRVYDVSGRTDLASAMNGSDSGAAGGRFPYGAGTASDETLNGVLYSVFCEFLEGDFEMVRVLVNALNEGNPGLDLGDETVDSIEGAFRKLREMMLAGKKYLTIIRFELIRLYEIQHSLRRLSYFDVFGRLRLTLQLARVTLSIPMAIDQAMKGEDDADAGESDTGEKDGRAPHDAKDANTSAKQNGGPAGNWDDDKSESDEGSTSGSQQGNDGDRDRGLDFGMCADDSDDDDDDEADDNDEDLLYGETLRDKRRRLRKVHRRERIAEARRAKLEARQAAAEQRVLQRRGLLGPTAAGLLKGVVHVLETSEAWVPGGGKKGAAAAAT